MVKVRLAKCANHLLIGRGGTGCLACLIGQHWVENFLECHYVCTCLPRSKKAAITGPVAIGKVDNVIVVAASEAGLHLANRDSLRLGCIPPSLLDLSD